MFHPNDNPMERGWVGRVEGETVVHLAAQTLQAFFLGGGSARAHAEYRLAEVTLLAPVLQPPTVRVFEAEGGFAFANTAAITGPGALVEAGGHELSLLPRLAAVIGADGQIGGTTLLGEWRAEGRPVPKDRDFALVLGPVVVTPDALDPAAVELVVSVGGVKVLRSPPPAFDWAGAVELAAAGTRLRAGDVIVAPAAGRLERVRGRVEVRAEGVGVLAQEAA